MTLQVTTLDGTPALSVTSGEEYLVPCVYGIPVICPSHVDEGTEGPTSRHWHTDERFGGINRSEPFWHPETWKDVKAIHGDYLRSDILKDEGQPVLMEKKKATSYTLKISGGVFTSLVWLYHNLGTQSANAGHCVHHRTPLIRQGECLQCPAHGLKYNEDGTPKFKAPFYISVAYEDWDGGTHRLRQPVSTGKHPVKFEVDGRFDSNPLVRLEDAYGQCISDHREGINVHQFSEGINKLTISFGVWPSSGSCPRLATHDPRPDVPRRLYTKLKKILKIKGSQS